MKSTPRGKINESTSFSLASDNHPLDPPVRHMPRLRERGASISSFDIPPVIGGDSSSSEVIVK